MDNKCIFSRKEDGICEYKMKLEQVSLKFKKHQ